MMLCFFVIEIVESDAPEEEGTGKPQVTQGKKPQPTNAQATERERAVKDEL